MPEKKTKAEVSYTPHAAKHNERCALCIHYIAGPVGQCRRVAGTISPRGWCELFRREGG